MCAMRRLTIFLGRHSQSVYALIRSRFLSKENQAWPLQRGVRSIDSRCFAGIQSDFPCLIKLFLFVIGGSLEDTRMESGAHQGGAGGMPPGSIYNSTGAGAPRSNSSSSSASPPTSVQTPSVNAAAAAAMLVVPQPINASKMGQQQGSIVSANGGTGRKYQCKMCPQVG